MGIYIGMMASVSSSVQPLAAGRFIVYPFSPSLYGTYGDFVSTAYASCSVPCTYYRIVYDGPGLVMSHD
jgi:hypothetical protein